MTWQEIQKATLDKVFSRTNYGVETPLNSADIADYVKAMPHNANFAFIDLAEVMPIYKSVEVEIDERMQGNRLYRVRELAPDFMRLCPDRLTITDEYNNFYRINDYQFDGDDQLYVPGSYVGTLVIWYEALPAQVTEETPGDATFELSEEAQRAIPLYIASQIFKEDDISMSVQYLNEYENCKAILRSRVQNTQSGGGFTSVWGWV